MKVALLIIFLVGASVFVKAQEKSTVSGMVLAAEKPLQGASVIVTRLKNSAKLATAISNDEGRFSLYSLPQNDSLKIEISFVGYAPYKGLLILKDKKFAMAPFILQPQSGELQAVVIKAEKLVLVKGDTIEFRASGIKTPPNSVAADLVKRIPGMELDRNGRITYNGRPVTKILVDGRTYFGEDGAIALANLPSDMIDKVQLSGDSLARQNGIEEQNAKSVLNFKLKPGRKMIAKGMVAGGTHSRYDGSVFASQIKDAERISVTAGRNNINKMGYNGDDNLQIFTNGSGIIKTTIGAVDYDNTLKSGNNINATYNFAFPTTYLETVKEKRQDVLPASTLVTQTTEAATNTNSNHGLGYRYELKGRKTTMYFSGNTIYNSLDNVNINKSATSNGEGHLLNSMDNSFRSKSRNLGTNLNIDGRRSFDKKGRVLGWNGNFNYSSRAGTDENDAMITFYESGVVDSMHHLHQEINNDSKSNTASFSINYTEPLSEKFNLNLISFFSYGRSYNDKTTWALDSLGKRKNIDSLYSNFTQNHSLTTSSDLSIEYKDKFWNVKTGLLLLHNSMLQKDIGHATEIAQKGFNPSVNLSVNYNGEKSSFNLSSSANYRLPTIQQLQPVQDVTNPLQIFIGNPNLKPQVNYSTLMNWNNRRPQIKGKPFISISGVGMSLNVTSGRITTSIRYDSLGKQVTTYQNVNGIYDYGVNTNLSLQKKWGKDFFKVELDPRLNYRKDRTFINGALYDNNSVGLNWGVSASYEREEMIFLSLGYSPYYKKLRYEQNATHNQAYTIHNLNLDADVYLFQRLKIKQSVSYTYNNSLNAGLKRSSMLWNATVSLICLKSRKLELVASAFDLLKQFNNLSRTVAANYIEDMQSNNLQRYFLLGVKYSFSKIM